MPAEPGRVLLAEDSALLAALLADALRAHSVAQVVEVFKDGPSFVAGFASALEGGEAPALLVLDIHLPGLDGLSAGRAVRGLERARGLLPAPIVFFSGSSLTDDVARGIADCFPARFVQKQDERGPGLVALEGARLIRTLLR